MKTLTLCLALAASLSSFAQSIVMEGKWRLESDRFSKPLVFMEIDNVTHEYSQEKFMNPNGTLAYTIDQAVKLIPSETGGYEGSVDFFDSRGCSYRDLAIKVEFTSPNGANILMTVPRYKVKKITTGHSSRYDGPLFCQGANPYPYRYVCGRQSDLRSTRTECELVETVEIPVRLIRL